MKALGDVELFAFRQCASSEHVSEGVCIECVLLSGMLSPSHCSPSESVFEGCFNPDSLWSLSLLVRACAIMQSAEVRDVALYLMCKCSCVLIIYA